MASKLQPPLVARNGHRLKVLGVARISTEHQDQLSLDDQEALYRRWLADHADSSFDLHMIAGRGSGEALDCEDARRARAEVETDTYDLVIAEDLGRIFRRSHAIIFCELCEDYQTRLIALNDHVDTAQDNWRVLAGFASMRHELYNADTAKRIRRSLRNRFQMGGVIQSVVFGYNKPPGTKTDAELQKDPAAEPIYAEMFRKLEDGASYSEVADWLNEQGVKPGPAARSDRWTCSLVTQLIHNPILKGIRVRNKKMSKRVNQTGRRKAVPAPPSERLERHCPHLAFIEPSRYDRLIRMLDARNAKYRRKGVGGIDPRRNVPKKRTLWPGQHIFCGICGHLFVYGGHGQKDHLMCRGAHQYRCWQAITVDGPLAAQQLIKAIRCEIESLPDFDPLLMETVRRQQQQWSKDKERRGQEYARQQAENQRQIHNILEAIKSAGSSSSLLAELQSLEVQKAQLESEYGKQFRTEEQSFELPSMTEIKALAARSFEELAMSSQEFGRLLRRLIPRIVVYPYRLCDGGHPVLRAHFTLSLVSLLVPAAESEQLASALCRSLVVDLFRAPQREAYRFPVMELTSNGLSQHEIAWELEITQPAVQRAMALSRSMDKFGVVNPYVPLTAPPDDYAKLRRHKHPRYRFEPLKDESDQTYLAMD
ncbi:MAG: recombinase family protein [Gemmataceae bacterium]